MSGSDSDNSDVDFEPMESDDETIDSYESDDFDLSEHEDDYVMLSDSWKRISDIFIDRRPTLPPKFVCNFSGVNPALNCNANNSVLECFKKFITDDVIAHIVKCINDRAKHFFEENPEKKGIVNNIKWKDVKDNDVYTFLALYFYMGLCKFSEMNLYCARLRLESISFVHRS